MTEAASIQIRTKPRSYCLFCNSEGRLLHDNLFDALFGAPGIWRLKECPAAACGLVWLDPAPLEEDLPIAYQNYHTHYSATAPGFVARLRAMLYSCYKAAKYLPSLLVGLRRAQRQMLYMYLENVKPGRLLDVGCGDGAFLKIMQRAGWEVDGMDFDAQAIASAKIKFGLNLRVGDLPSAKFPENYFDAITLSHVIEHVPEPMGLMTEINRVLKPGGRFVLTTPNIRSRGHKKFQKFWRGLEPPRHLNIFSLSALATCAERTRFEILHLASTSAYADIIIGGSYFIRHAYQQRDANAAQPQINPLRGLASLLFQYVEFFSLRRDPEAGEEAVLICTKKAA